MRRGMQVVLAAVAVLLLALGGLVAFVQSRPSTLHIERSATYAAAPQDVYAYTNDFKRFLEWNPWTELEPDAKVTLSDPPAGVGASYAWQGDETGSGRMTITESVPNEKVVSDLAFVEPFEAEARITMAMTPDGDKTRLVWAYDAELGFPEKAMGLLVDMDAMLGKDFEKGLSNLGPKVEAAARTRADQEAAAKLATETPPPAPPAGSP